MKKSQGYPAVPGQKWIRRGATALLLAGGVEFFLTEKDSAWTLWVGLALYFLSLPLLWEALAPVPRPSKSFERPPSFRLEVFLFSALKAVALFLRIYRLQTIPDGVFADRAEVALGATRIIQEHWRPFLETLSLHVPELCVYYLAAGWFWLFGTSPELFAYFDVFLSVAGLWFSYAVFRQLAGPRAALLGFAFYEFVPNGHFGVHRKNGGNE